MLCLHDGQLNCSTFSAAVIRDSLYMLCSIKIGQPASPPIKPLGCALLLAQEYQARFESCSKLYSFHFWETPDLSQPLLPAALARTQSSSSSRREVAHYGSRPYQALYEGYFLEPAAAKAYLAVFQASHKAPPYNKDILRVNSDHLADLVSSNRVCCRCCCRSRCCPPPACLGSRPPRMNREHAPLLRLAASLSFR